MVVEETAINPKRGDITEILVYASPVVRKWARWKVRKWFTILRHRWFKKSTIQKIQVAATSIDYDVLHVVDHGPFSDALCNDKFCGDKPLWVSFHDHYSTTFGSYTNSKILWERAARRLVISDELGLEYARLFGNATYELITDGVTRGELSNPQNDSVKPITVYFAGLLHIDYIPLFKVLADALDILVEQGYSFELVLRGTQHVPFLDRRPFTICYRDVSLNDKELKEELDSSSILYLPIKFTRPDFYKYSLSTKMVGYLGSSGAILYHGPLDSAACNLLTRANAAVSCGELNATVLSKDIVKLIAEKAQISANAKVLAIQRFDMEEIQRRFWQEGNL
ncbi:hypothetical protein DYU05_09410 [Mucilaginibacter terrenus]|uniref:Glycosyltransferase family 1 protein n=1 Tax=Mucilaginibacter terrenus TaxID=2482727 RepID=A0A3E2NXT4_9SPHI|nr:hypothetical protein DYU05_09410 [Mucilaginibacter terrenus]